MNKEAQWLLQEKYNGEKTESFFTDLNRLESGEPLGYVIGHVPFLNTTINLDSHPLIPRTETEFWVGNALQEIQSLSDLVPKSATCRVLDLCAGSGCVGVAILKNTEHTFVDFVEFDEAHHKTIKKNIEKNEIDISRATILGGNLFELVDKTYDYILANPPYIDPAIDRAEESVKKYEPGISLYGGFKGMELITRIIRGSESYLTEQGVLYMEHEPEQEKAINQLATQNGLIIESFPDQFGIIRYTRFNRKK